MTRRAASRASLAAALAVAAGLALRREVRTGEYVPLVLRPRAAGAPAR